MKKITIIALIIFMLANTNIFAQTDTAKYKPNSYKHSFGIGAGFSSGYGFSYRYFPNQYGVQVNFAPFLSSNSTVVSIGTLGLISLDRTKKSDFYIYYGGHLHNYNNIRKNRTRLFYGIGPGIQLNLSEHVSWDFMVGYGGSQTIAYKDRNNQNYFPDGFRIGYTIETALYFRFN